MARLIGNTRRRTNWVSVTALAVIIAMLGGAAAWLSTFLGSVAH